MEDSGQSSVASSVGVDDFRLSHSPALCVINFELFCVAKMLKNLAIFISDCNSHSIGSFLFFVLLMIGAFKTFVVPAAFLAVAQTVIASPDAQRTSLHQGQSQFFSGVLIDPLNGSSGDLHPLAALLLGQTLQIHKTDRFIFVYSKNNRCVRLALLNGKKTRRRGKMAYTPAFCWS